MIKITSVKKNQPEAYKKKMTLDEALNEVEIGQEQRSIYSLMMERHREFSRLFLLGRLGSRND